GCGCGGAQGGRGGSGGGARGSGRERRTARLRAGGPLVPQLRPARCARSRSRRRRTRAPAPARRGILIVVTAEVRAEADAPLRRDVRLLGAVLGKVIAEQEGDDLLEAEERIRLLARDARGTGDADAARDAVRLLTPDEQ